jgi:hypothetical protein
MAINIFQTQIPSSSVASTRRVIGTTVFLDPAQFFLPVTPRPTPTPTGGGTTPAPPAPAAPAPPTTTTDPLVSLNIPIAQEGLPITSDYHNSLRDALMAIARRLGISQVTSGAILSFAPGFLPHTPDAPWALDYGFAKASGFAPATGPLPAKGWMPIGLPDGARIQKMTVLGAKTGNISQFDIKLLRQPFDQTTTSTLVAIANKDITASPFTVSVPVQVAGLPPSAFNDVTLNAALEDFKLVDNTKYKYLVTAEVNGDAAATAQITTIEIGIEL